MKAHLLALLLLLTLPVVAQTTDPMKGASAIVVHSPDSAKTAYTKMLKGMLLAGYGIDKSDKDALFLSTPPKSVDGAVSVKLQAVATSTPTGSDIIFRGVYTWINALTIQAHIQNRELPIQFLGGNGSPTKRAWREMQNAATVALPGASITYK